MKAVDCSEDLIDSKNVILRKYPGSVLMDSVINEIADLINKNTTSGQSLLIMVDNKNESLKARTVDGSNCINITKFGYGGNAQSINGAFLLTALYDIEYSLKNKSLWRSLESNITKLLYYYILESYPFDTMKEALLEVAKDDLNATEEELKIIDSSMDRCEKGWKSLSFKNNPSYIILDVS